MASRYAEASNPAELAAVIRRRQIGRALLLLLDYDGTLTPLVDDPEHAVPDEELVTLLLALARTPGIDTHVISGRTRNTLEQWLGLLPIGLHAEHGAYSRAASASTWRAHATASTNETMDIVRRMIAPFMVEGALLEAKELGLAWHYRAMERRTGVRHALSLSRHLREALRGTAFTVVRGSRVLEVRPRGVTKGQLAASLAAALAPSLVVAIGDDRTDEDMFRALDESAIAIHVGDGGSRAGWRLEDVSAVRALLWELADAADATG